MGGSPCSGARGRGRCLPQKLSAKPRLLLEPQTGPGAGAWISLLHLQGPLAMAVPGKEAVFRSPLSLLCLPLPLPCLGSLMRAPRRVAVCSPRNHSPVLPGRSGGAFCSPPPQGGCLPWGPALWRMTPRSRTRKLCSPQPWALPAPAPCTPKCTLPGQRGLRLLLCNAFSSSQKLARKECWGWGLDP